MKVFNNLEEMKPYYNKETNTYEFIENNILIDIKIDFDLNIECNIKAGDIKSGDIKSGDINAWDINSGDIKSCNIKSSNINARNINSWNINARDIKASNINSNKISFYSVCFAYKTFVCNSIEGRRKNSKYFCLDSEVVIKSKKS